MPSDLQPCPDLVYKICGTNAWAGALTAGVYAGSADDQRDGFIHFSLAHQLPGTLARHFGGRADLVLLAVRAADLGDALRFEASRGGDLFPHLYGPLAVTAVQWQAPLPLGADGIHTLPIETSTP